MAEACHHLLCWCLWGQCKGCLASLPTRLWTQSRLLAACLGPDCPVMGLGCRAGALGDSEVARYRRWPPIRRTTCQGTHGVVWWSLLETNATVMTELKHCACFAVLEHSCEGVDDS